MPKKLEDCVRKVKRKGKVKNAWAVCNAALDKKRKHGRLMADPKFAYGQRVKVDEVKAAGRVVCVYFDQGGVCYDVRYPMNGEYKTARFFEDELKSG